jgi:hypothetical protein
MVNTEQVRQALQGVMDLNYIATWSNWAWCATSI